jgi:hypothetical protein
MSYGWFKVLAGFNLGVNVAEGIALTDLQVLNMGLNP